MYYSGIGHARKTAYADALDADYRPRMVRSEILTLRRSGARGRLQIGLHEPGTVRALLDEAIAGGWDADDPATTQADGWAHFDVVAGRRARTTHA